MSSALAAVPEPDAAPDLLHSRILRDADGNLVVEPNPRKVHWNFKGFMLWTLDVADDEIQSVEFDDPAAPFSNQSISADRRAFMVSVDHSTRGTAGTFHYTIRLKRGSTLVPTVENEAPPAK